MITERRKPKAPNLSKKVEFMKYLLIVDCQNSSDLNVGLIKIC